jgi:hypothetical protein
LSEAAATVGVRRMTYPHDLSALEAVHAALLADVKR